MGKFFFGVVVGIIIILGIPALWVVSGAFNVAATSRAGFIERAIAEFGREESVDNHAQKMTNPYANDPSVLPAGLKAYREDCMTCHGVPGVERSDIAKGLNPHPPHLAWKGFAHMPDGEMFWVIKNGYRMTGMPGFGPTHSDEQIWQIVSFVRHLPNLTPEEKALLTAASNQASPNGQGGAQPMTTEPGAKGTTEPQKSGSQAAPATPPKSPPASKGSSAR